MAEGQRWIDPPSDCITRKAHFSAPLAAVMWESISLSHFIFSTFLFIRFQQGNCLLPYPADFSSVPKPNNHSLCLCPPAAQRRTTKRNAHNFPGSFRSSQSLTAVIRLIPVEEMSSLGAQAPVKRQDMSGAGSASPQAEESCLWPQRSEESEGFTASPVI